MHTVWLQSRHRLHCHAFAVWNWYHTIHVCGRWHFSTLWSMSNVYRWSFLVACSTLLRTLRFLQPLPYNVRLTLLPTITVAIVSTKSKKMVSFFCAFDKKSVAIENHLKCVTQNLDQQICLCTLKRSPHPLFAKQKLWIWLSSSSQDFCCCLELSCVTLNILLCFECSMSPLCFTKYLHQTYLGLFAIISWVRWGRQQAAAAKGWFLKTYTRFPQVLWLSAAAEHCWLQGDPQLKGEASVLL